MVMAKKKNRRRVAVCSDSDSDFDDGYQTTKTPKKLLRAVLPVQNEPEVMGVAPDDNGFDGEGDDYMKMASDVVDKNTKLVKLFDPSVMDGFTMLMNRSEKVGQATKAMEACAKVYTQKVDTLYTGVQKVSTAMVKLNEKNSTKGSKKITFANENLDYWLADEDPHDSVRNDSQALLSGEDDEPVGGVRAEMTMAAEFNRDMTMAPADMNMSAEFGDTSELGQKVKAFCKNRMLLTKGKLMTIEQLDLRFKRADDAARKYMATERVKMFGGLKQNKKLTIQESTVRKDYTQLDYPFFSHAMVSKRENAHVALEDVAETNDDCSLVYLHNYFKEDDVPTRMADELEDWTVDDMENIEIGTDMVSSVLEHLQGTFENSTAEEHKLPDRLVEIFGLEKRDLKKVRITEAYCNVSFEQTASKDIDEGKMIDQLENLEEEEAATKELTRLDNLTTELLKDRENLLESAQNPREMSIRQEMHRPKYTPYYDDEDRFFNFDYRHYITKDSLSKEMTESGKLWLQSLTQDAADDFEMNDSLFKVLKNLFSSQFDAQTTNWEAIFSMIPNYVFGKILLSHYRAITPLYDEVKRFESILLPFRVSRYAEFVVSSVLHECQAADMEDNRSRVTSAMSFRSGVSPKKKPRMDETVNADGFVYFFALEKQATKRYSEQQVTNESYHNMLQFIVEKMQDERHMKLTDKGTNDPTLLDAYWALLTVIGYFHDHVKDDLSDVQVIDVSAIEDNVDEVASVPMEQEEMLNSLVAKLDVQMLDQKPDVPFFADNDDAGMNDEFTTARNTPFDEPTLQENLFNDSFPDAPMSPTKSVDGADRVSNFNEMSRLNDSLASLLNDFEDIPLEQPERPKSKLNFVKDTAHYDDDQVAKKAPKKKKKDLELADQFVDDLAFAPRDTFTNVSTRRGRSRTPTEENDLQHIMRIMDVTLPEQLYCPPAFRIDDQLTLAIPGYSDPDRMFVSFQTPNASRGLELLYRGKYSHLPPTATMRQDYDLFFFTRYHKLRMNIEQAKYAEKSASLAVANDNPEFGHVSMNMDDEDEDYPFFDAPEMMDVLKDLSGRTDLTNVNDFCKEYGNVDSDFEIDEDVEDDEFDFESVMVKGEAKRFGQQCRYRLKRAIRFILSRAFLDRSSIKDEIAGLAPPSRETPLREFHRSNAFSTPATAKYKTDVLQDIMDPEDDMIISGFENVEGLQEPDEEEVPFDETDETKMKPFKVKGFHTFRSLLYYLPKYCVPETVEILSAAHVFSIICHMVNENRLHMSQDMYGDDDVETRNDYVIENYEDYESRMAEIDLDEHLRFSDDD